MAKSTMPEYQAYKSAKNRCSNPKSSGWNNYGGRGIRFLFESFEQFYAELGPRPIGKSLDRKDNDGNYEPGNVRWATPSEQIANTRLTRLNEVDWFEQAALLRRLEQRHVPPRCYHRTMSLRNLQS